MTLAAAFVLAAGAAQAAPAVAERERGEEPVVETARVTVEILRPAVLRNGKLTAGHSGEAPRHERRSGSGRVTYEFE